MAISFHINCIPPKSTHQAALRILRRRDGTQFLGKCSSSKGKHVQNELLMLFAPHAPPAPMQGALTLNVYWAYPWRKSEKKANIAKGAMLCDTRPDCDNLAKFIMDILTRLGFYKDDGQVASLNFTKSWSNAPGITVTLDSAEE